MRALITNFHITSLIRKVDKNMNLLGIVMAQCTAPEKCWCGVDVELAGNPKRKV